MSGGCVGKFLGQVRSNQLVKSDSITENPGVSILHQVV